MISPDHLKALRYLTDKTGSIRPHLAGVHVTIRGGSVTLAATTGEVMGMLVCVGSPLDLPPEPFTIGNDACDQIVKAAKGKPVTVAVGPNGYLEAAGVFFKPLEGAYPDVRRVIPATTSGNAAQFDPELLMRFAKTAKALGGKSGYVMVDHNGNDSATVRIPGRADFIGVVMPLRSTYVEKWVLPIAAAFK